MPTRITGMSSGLDTESIIQELVKAKSTKVTKLKKDNTKLEWKQEAWKDLNKELRSLQSKFGNLRYSSDLRKKKTTSSDTNAVRVITGGNAMNSVQTLSIKSLAKSGYLTGQKITSAEGGAVTGDSLVSELGLKDADGNPISGLFGVDGGSFTVTTGGKSHTISISDSTKITDVVRQLKEAGVSANFDEKNQRLFIGASGSGVQNDFTITADNAGGLSAMSLLGINVDPSSEANTAASQQYAKYAAVADKLSGMSLDDILADVDSDVYKMLKAEADKLEDTEDYDTAYAKLVDKMNYAKSVVENGSNASLYSTGAVKLAGADAVIELNGAEFTSDTNNIEVNGLTFECRAVADNITITTEDDTDGVYDMVKDLLKQYNEVINKMDKLYNAESAKGYEPLTDEEKDALSESEIEKLEGKIKDSLLRKDSVLGSVFNGMKDVMAAGIMVGDKEMFLSDFGISTLSYFEAADNEHSALHIDGDSDDEKTSANPDKLKTMISTNPDAVVEFFSKLSQAVYTKMNELSASSETSSFGSFYEDKQMKTDLADYVKKIATAELKLSDYEDKFYAKFAKMESALSAMEAKNNYLSGLFS